MYDHDAFYNITLFFISLNFTSKHNIQQIMLRKEEQKVVEMLTMNMKTYIVVYVYHISS